MRAVIIEDDRFAELVETLELQKASLAKNGGNFLARKPEGMDQAHWESVIQDVHKAFHCTFVRWAQSHGARCVR